MNDFKSTNTQKKIKVWDGAVRLFHWVLVVVFCLSAYSAFQDKFGIYADMHLNAGIAIIILVVWRIAWGIAGSETARFRHFVKSPSIVIQHLKHTFSKLPYREIGHNPLGGLSVILMLFLLLAQALMGLFASDGMIFSGPLARDVAGSLSSDLTTWHKLLGRILIGVVVFHVVVVLLYAALKRVNLIWPMITGTTKSDSEVTAPKMRPAWQALILFFAAGAAVCLSIF